MPKETSYQSSESKVLLVVADLICVDPNGMIFVGDFRVCVFNADGTKPRSHAFSPQRLSACSTSEKAWE